MNERTDLKDRTKQFALRISKMVLALPELSLTPCFSWVWAPNLARPTVSTVCRPAETVETVGTLVHARNTQLKQGVNEKGAVLRGLICDSSRFAFLTTISKKVKARLALPTS